MSESASSAPKIKTVPEALRSLDEIGVDRSLIATMNDAEYKELATSLGWTAAVTIGLRANLRLTCTATSMPSTLLSTLLGKKMPTATSHKDPMTTATRATAAATAGGVASSAGSNATLVAQLRAQLAEAHAAAALSTKTRELAAKAEAEDKATFRKVTALHTATRATPADLRAAVRSLARKGTMQVAFVMDGTGSMAPHILTVKERIITIAAQLEKGTCASPSFALVVYRDYEDGADHINVFPFGTASALEATLGTVKATGGADAAEDCFGGLSAAMTRLTWNTPARLIIWIGDAPNHGTTYNGGCNDSHPSMDKLPISGPALALLASQLDIATSFMKLGTITDAMINCLQREYSEAGAQLQTIDGSGKNLEGAIVSEMTCTAMRTHTATAKRREKAGPIVEIPLVPCSPKDAAYGTKASCVVLTAQPCNRSAASHPFDLLLSDYPLMHQEKREAVISKSPFSKGEMRLAYHCKLSRSEKTGWFWKWRSTTHVAKAAIKRDSRLGKRQMHMQTIACFLGNEFNARRAYFRGLNYFRPITYLPVQLLQLVDEKTGKPSEEMWMLEPFVEGNYCKFNNNNGHVNKALLPTHPVPQAFSHFTYEYSGGRLLVADIQGVVGSDAYNLTDPAIHTCNPDSFLPDDTNLGVEGIAAFFKTHVCNYFCKALSLPDRHALGDSMLEMDAPGSDRSASCVSNAEVLASHKLEEM